MYENHVAIKYIFAVHKIEIFFLSLSLSFHYINIMWKIAMERGQRSDFFLLFVNWIFDFFFLLLRSFRFLMTVKCWSNIWFLKISRVWIEEGIIHFQAMTSQMWNLKIATKLRDLFEIYDKRIQQHPDHDIVSPLKALYRSICVEDKILGWDKKKFIQLS